MYSSTNLSVSTTLAVISWSRYQIEVWPMFEQFIGVRDTEQKQAVGRLYRCLIIYLISFDVHCWDIYSKFQHSLRLDIHPQHFVISDNVLISASVTAVGEAGRMKLIALLVVLSCCLVHACCNECSADEIVTVQQQWNSTFGSNPGRLFDFGVACFLRSAVPWICCIIIRRKRTVHEMWMRLYP